jgi:hypothetical protein
MWKRMYIVRGRATEEEGKGGRGQVVIMTQRRLEKLWRKPDRLRLVLIRTLAYKQQARSIQAHRSSPIFHQCFLALAKCQGNDVSVVRAG